MSINAYLYKAFKNDPFIKQMALDNSKLINPIVGLQSITDYRIYLLNLMTNFVKDDAFYEKLSFGVGMVNILVFIVFAFRLFYKLRNIE